MPQITPKTTRAERFAWLDAFRLLPAMTVVIVHARGAAVGPFGLLPAEDKTLVGAAFYLFARTDNEAVVAFLVLSSLFVIGMATERIHQGDFSFADSVDAGRILLAAGFALLIQQLVLCPPRKAWARRLDTCGGYGAAFSYSLYQTHYPIIQLVAYLGLPQSACFDARAIGGLALLVLCSLAAAWISYWLFERHTPAVKRWLEGELAQRRGASAGVAPGSGV